MYASVDIGQRELPEKLGLHSAFECVIVQKLSMASEVYIGASHGFLADYE